MIIWELWKEHNRRIFKGEKINLRRCLKRIVNEIKETVSVSATKRQAMQIPYTKDDSMLQSSWLWIDSNLPQGHW